ncbi:hypothetical protein HBH43_200480 [Parastagonospora nodorum]|nr:hypothetical protein HBH43_200480 [Parastagonospora nodorum]
MHAYVDALDTLRAHRHLLCCSTTTWLTVLDHIYCADVFLGVGESVSHTFGYRQLDSHRHLTGSHSNRIAGFFISWISDSWVRGSAASLPALSCSAQTLANRQAR